MCSDSVIFWDIQPGIEVAYSTAPKPTWAPQNTQSDFP